ncbi:MULTISPECIES: hypothetical protein [unclassified Methylobacterium]|uniref:hypothetical protein n=1 Tax=unclassified Methylobacterium TaxID=2615210 RepID=UPI00035E4CDF|nr:MULTISPECIES: hypothetical protein [unclassified Methylobacterium]KQP52297.1 hypothetical protein ASF34_17665 [Methylobacterium sp. Leaf106]
MTQEDPPSHESLDVDSAWGQEPTTSGFDQALSELGAAERRAEAERRMRYRAAGEFLAAFYKSDVESAKALKQRGVSTGFKPNQIAFAKAGRPAEVVIVVTGGGDFSVLFAPGGQRATMQRVDLGEFDPLTKTAMRKRMIQVVIGYLGMGD